MRPKAISTIRLKPGREKSVLRGHPWIFSGALARVPADLKSGQVVSVLSAEGDFLAWGTFSPQSQISVRVWSLQEAVELNIALLESRLSIALERRQGLLNTQTNACRLVHSEADGLPGLIVDVYAEAGVFQILSTGIECYRSEIMTLLRKKLPHIRVWVERSDADVRALEGLALRTEVAWGALPKTPLIFCENGLQYYVDLLEGHKTGFYLDQRLNRQKLSVCVAQKRVLNCFSYTGGFTLAALQGGAAEVISVDSSRPALVWGEKNQALNGFEARKTFWMEADVFEALRHFRDQGQGFDTIILDPPKFAPTAAHVEKAARAYKDINLLALKLLNPGGHLWTFSCSSGISADLFRKIVAGSAADAKKEAWVVDTLAAGRDHPIRLSFPEGEYLKGLQLSLV